MSPKPASLRQFLALLRSLFAVIALAVVAWQSTAPLSGQSPTGTLAAPSEHELGALTSRPVSLNLNQSAVPDSWNWVPAQVDFYWGGHQLAMQIDRFESSSTVARLRETNLWSTVTELFWKEWKDRKSDLARVKAILDNPSARDVRKFLFDMASEDLFVVVDEHLSKSLAHWNAIQPDLERLADPKLTTELRAEIIARWIDERLPDYQIPTMIIGGKFSDTNAALSKIDEVEGLLRLGLAAVPDLRQFFKFLKRVEDPRGNRLTWTLNSEVIPWDSIPETDFLDRESLDSLRRELEGKTFQCSIGTVDQYFCIVIGGDRNWIERVGSEQCFKTIPAVETLRGEAANIRESSSNATGMTSTYYTSDALVQGCQTLLLDGFFRKLARSALMPLLDTYPKESDTAEWLTSVIDDAGWLDERIGSVVPRFRGIAQCGWIDDFGFQSLRIDRNPTYVLQAAGSLEALNNIDGSPLLLLDLQLAQHPEFLGVTKDIVRRIRERLRESTKLDDARWDKSAATESYALLESYWPLVETITEVWEKQILPGWQGEHCVVIQAGSLDARQWSPLVAGSEQPLPVPEIAWVSRLEKRDDWERGIIAVARTIVEKHPVWGESAAQKVISWTDEADRMLSAWHRWSLPVELPFLSDNKSSPIPTLADHPKWSWIGYSPGQWEGYAKRVSGGPEKPSWIIVEDPAAPLATYAHVDFGGWVRLLEPWVEYALQRVPRRENGSLAIPPTKTGRRLEISVQDVVKFVQQASEFGVLSSWSWRRSDGFTQSRSVYRVPDR